MTNNLLKFALLLACLLPLACSQPSPAAGTAAVAPAAPAGTAQADVVTPPATPGAPAAAPPALQPAAAAPTMPAPTAEATPALPSTGPQSPIQVRLSGPNTVPTRGEIELRVAIDRARPDLAPIQVDIRLPAGARLAAGNAQERIADTTLLSLERTWRIRYDRAPKGDVTVVVDWQTQGAGFHAELPWRFGRPEAKRAAPPRLPGPVVLPGGRSLGKPILTGGSGGRE
jgi:hypothetical protein